MDGIRNWLQSFEPVTIYAYGNGLLDRYANDYIYNMHMNRGLLPCLEFGFPSPKGCVLLGKCEYGQGCVGVLVYDTSDGKIKKFYWDGGFDTRPLMEFSTLEDMLNYDNSCTYPQTYQEIVDKLYELGAYNATHIFL